MTQIDGQPGTAKPKRDWSLNNWGPRLIYCLLAGFVINMSTGINAIGTTVSVVLFVLITAIVAVRRR